MDISFGHTIMWDQEAMRMWGPSAPCVLQLLAMLQCSSSMVMFTVAKMGRRRSLEMWMVSIQAGYCVFVEWVGYSFLS